MAYALLGLIKKPNVSEEKKDEIIQWIKENVEYGRLMIDFEDDKDKQKALKVFADVKHGEMLSIDLFTIEVH